MVWVPDSEGGRTECYTPLSLGIGHPLRLVGTTDVSRGIHPTVGQKKEDPSRQRRFMPWARHGTDRASQTIGPPWFNRR